MLTDFDAIAPTTAATIAPTTIQGTIVSMVRVSSACSRESPMSRKSSAIDSPMISAARKTGPAIASAKSRMALRLR